jgi:hypothetical protein
MRCCDFRSAPPRHRSSAAAALFVRRAALGLRPPKSLATFKLTPTEPRLAGHHRSRRIPIATAFGVADTTVRTHVNRLFEKTGHAASRPRQAGCRLFDAADRLKATGIWLTPCRGPGHSIEDARNGPVLSRPNSNTHVPTEACLTTYQFTARSPTQRPAPLPDWLVNTPPPRRPCHRV